VGNLHEQLMKKLDDSKDEIIQIREYLHAHPEVSFKEKNTSSYIKKIYQNIDCKIR